MTNRQQIARTALLSLAMLAAVTTTAGAQGNRYYEQTYMGGAHNFAFNDAFPAASKLFNSFDYGHAIIYETLWRFPASAAGTLDGKEYSFITSKLLIKPPHVPLDESAIGPNWSLLAPETLAMFSWAHMLHRQLYDVFTHDLDRPAERDAHVKALIAYYQSRPALAFSTKPKDMELMEGQSYSLAFRKQNPKFNGLMWSYHWAQMTLYDALMAGQTRADQEANVTAVIGRFFDMLKDPPRTLPSQMPMSPAIAPMFSEQYPEAAIIFDNLHSLHDVVSDILANPAVPRDKKREAILVASAKYRDNTSNVTSLDDWTSMANMMGLDAQGGPAPLPRRTTPKASSTPHKHPGS